MQRPQKECKALYSIYCPAPGVDCGSEDDPWTFKNTVDNQLPPGCSVDASAEPFDYTDAKVYFNKGVSDSFPSSHKKLCQVNLFDTVRKTRTIMNQKRRSESATLPMLKLDSQLTQTAFAVALSAYKNLKAGKTVEEGYSIRIDWTGQDLVVDGAETFGKAGDVVFYRGKARKCNTGTESNYAGRMVKQAFAKKPLLKKRLYNADYTFVGSARICTGRQGPAKGSIEVVMFA